MYITCNHVFYYRKNEYFLLEMCNFKNHDFLGQKHIWPKVAQMCYKVEFHQKNSIPFDV
jgi:hypothetical protein